MKIFECQTSFEIAAKALHGLRIGYAAVAFTALSLVPLISHSGEDRTLEPQRLALAAALQRVLLRSADCQRSAACDPNDNLFVSPSRKGLSVEVFGITNYELASTLMLVAFAEAALMSGPTELEIQFCTDSKAVDLNRPIWRSRNNFVHAVIQGGSNAKR